MGNDEFVYEKAVERHRCVICGAKEEYENEIVNISTMSGYAHYGSVHDEDHVSIGLCQGCLDALLRIQERMEADQ